MADINSLAGAGMIGVLIAMGTMLIFLGLIIYVYMALAWMTIAKKLGYDKPWLAWIPIANLFLIPILAKKNWPWGFIFLVPIANIVFYIMWTWNIFEQRKYPGWLSLLSIGGAIPLVGWLATIAYLVINGVVAWVDR